MKNILFIHRSVGQNLINDGYLPEFLNRSATNAGIEINFADINNNINHDIPGNDTKPQDYLNYFTNQSLTEDLVIIKSCYPTNKIGSDQKLEELKQIYKGLMNAFYDNSKGKLLLLTSPPLRPLSTNKADANRARRLALWLTGQGFGKRIYIFDLYDMLAEPIGTKNANTLRKEYRRAAPWDNHPNVSASMAVSNELANHVTSLLI